MKPTTIAWRVGIKPFLTPDQLYTYAQAVHQRSDPLQNCFGFVDVTVRPIARPKYHQRILYDGHKGVHAIKFQSIVLPNGIIGNLSGSYEGKLFKGPFFKRKHL